MIYCKDTFSTAFIFLLTKNVMKLCLLDKKEIPLHLIHSSYLETTNSFSVEKKTISAILMSQCQTEGFDILHPQKQSNN